MRIGNPVIAGYGYRNTETRRSEEQQDFLFAAPKRITVFSREEAVASEWIDSGLSFWLRYDEESTEENPCMIAEGIDENGNSFCEKIFIKDVDPKNATYIEMTALETHLNGGKSVSAGMTRKRNTELGLNDRYNFADNYQEYVNLLAQSRWQGYEEYNRYMAEFERNLFEQFRKAI